MKKTVFSGVGTALITPLDQNGVDFPKLKALIEWQIAQGVDALIVCGTTGEKSTLDTKEHQAVTEFAIETVNHRIPVIAGTGSIALGTDGKKTVCRCGGWEHLLSDEGSATWLGLPLLRAVVQDEDGQVRAPMIRSLLADHAGIRTAMDAVSFAAAHIREKSDIAGLATLLEPAAEAGDEEAKRILEDAAGHLFALVENLAPRICEKGTFDLLLWGSVLHKNQAICASLTGRVHQAWPLARVLLPTCTALDCAVLLAQDRRALAYREI